MSILLCFFIALYSLFQWLPKNDSDSTLCWQVDRKLVWEDFKGEIPLSEINSKTTAVCPAKLIVEGFIEDDIPNFTVKVIFLKYEAWTKDSISNYILGHEQLHFDIAELHGREIRKAVKKLRKNRTSDVQEYEKAISIFLSKNRQMNLLYDKETAHGIYKDHQQRWEKQVNEKLEELNEFASSFCSCEL